MGKRRSAELVWEYDGVAFVLAEERGEGRGRIHLYADDADGWRYRAVVRESGGRLIVSRLRIEPPREGVSGLDTERIRAARPPAILEAGRREDARLRDESPEAAEDRLLGTQMAAQWAADNLLPDMPKADIRVALDWLKDHPPGPTHLLTSDAYKRLAKPRGAKRRVRDTDRYPWIAALYLIEIREGNARKPNVGVEARLKAAGITDVNAKKVSSWVDLAANRYGWLTGRIHGVAYAEPTDKLLEWAAARPDVPAAQWLMEHYGKGER